jgi:2-keto-4-pentenoate hydratase/2-oxohepta-3-ene-1,7-dioic acid hydratase in catechol pathway
MLVSYHEGDPAKPRLGVRADGVVRQPPAEVAALDLLEVLADWDALTPLLRALDPANGAAVPGATLLAPLRYPPKVLCAGANYYAHLAEMGIARPAGPVPPYFFFKPPSTTVIGPDQPILLPERPGRQIDWEVELAVVIGRRCRRVPVERAREVVAGWTVVNDISARDRLHRDSPVAPPFGFDWFGAKAEDTFCPMGPGLVPDWLVDDPHRLALWTTVNGVRKQDSSTEDMVTGIWALIAAASEVTTLEPGDVIATGTPAGVGYPRGDFLAPGDEVVVAVDGVGTLRNVVAEAAGHPERG